MSEQLGKIFFPLSILGLWLLFFYDALLGNTVWVSGLYVMETWMDTFPYKEFITHSYQSGFFPLWTHNLECGYPLGSYPHSGSFYPFNFFFFLGYVRGLNLLSLFQVLLLNFFSYFCFQELGFNRLTAWVFSLSFAFFGFAYISAGSLHFHSTLCWIPLVFWFSLRLVRNPSLANSLGLFLGFLIQFSGGELEQIIYQDLLILCYLILVWRVSGRKILLWGILVILSGLGCMIQILPSLNLMVHSYRHLGLDAHPYPVYLSYLLSPIGLVSPGIFPVGPLLIPSPFYLGMMFLLGIYQAWKTSEGRREVKILLVLGILYLVFLANLWPINHWTLLHKFISPDAHYKLIAPFQFWMLITAGRGINQLFEFSLERERIRSSVYFIIGFTFFTLLLATGFLVAEAKNPYLGFRIPVFARGIFGIFSLIVALFFLFKLKKELPKRWFLFFLVLVFLGDLLSSALPIKPGQSSQPFLDKPEGAKFLQRKNALARIRFVSSVPFLDQELLRYYDLSRGPGYVYTAIRLSLARTTPWLLKSLSSDSNLIIRNMTRINFQNKPVLDQLGVRYIVAQKQDRKGAITEAIQQMNAELARIFQLIYDDEVFIYENNSAWERFFLAKRGAEEPDPEIGSVQVLKYEMQRIELWVFCKEAGRLVNMESFYPGWRAYVNGSEQRILFAYKAFQAIEVPRGESKVVLMYQPWDFEVGLWFSLASLVGFFGLLMILVTKKLMVY